MVLATVESGHGFTGCRKLCVSMPAAKSSGRT
jgi:hypothetical protein